MNENEINNEMDEAIETGVAISPEEVKMTSKIMQTELGRKMRRSTYAS